MIGLTIIRKARLASMERERMNLKKELCDVSGRGAGYLHERDHYRNLFSVHKERADSLQTDYNRLKQEVNRLKKEIEKIQQENRHLEAEVGRLSNHKI